MIHALVISDTKVTHISIIINNNQTHTAIKSTLQKLSLGVLPYFPFNYSIILHPYAKFPLILIIYNLFTHKLVKK